jgi:DNA-binding beta-propeller fold protein YncE
MKHTLLSLASVISAAVLMSSVSQAEILAMMNYESKPEDSLRALKLPVGPQARREGIAILDVDPKSENYGKLLIDMPLPPDLVAHHIFYNPDASKAYVTALGKPLLHVIDMRRSPYRIKKVDVPECQIGEDVVFSADNKHWYLTCMGSNKVIVGDATSDTPTKSISVPNYPHGIAIHDRIDRLLITSTVRHTDLGDAGETITAIEASTGKVLSTHKVSNKPSPAGEAPVEILFVPSSNPPVAYITNMYGGTLWTATWDPKKEDFDVALAFDLSAQKVGVPLEIYFDSKADRLYVTTAKPGHLHIFDISADPSKPKLLKSIPANEGAHHVAFTKDWRLAFVQNSFLNLPGMNDGSITVVDLNTQEGVGTIDTLKDMGLNPNSIVLLPQWNHPAGH